MEHNWGDYYADRSDEDEELAGNGLFTLSFLSSITGKSVKTWAAFVNGARTPTGTASMAASVDEPIRFGPSSFVRRRKVVRVMGSPSGQKVVYEQPEDQPQRSGSWFRLKEEGSSI